MTDTTNASPTPMDIARQCAALHSRVFSRLITRHYNSKLADLGLRITQFTVLNAIKVSPPESIHQLAETLGMERTSLQRTVEMLISKGLVRSEPSGHKRALGLSLTAEGEAIYQQAVECWQQAHDEFTTLVGQDNWDTVAGQLHRLSKQVKTTL